jgi:hypothetical protein
MASDFGASVEVSNNYESKMVPVTGEVWAPVEQGSTHLGGQPCG